MRRKKTAIPARKKDPGMRRIDAAGGVVYRQNGKETEILLIFRKGIWDLPKGKKEPGENFEDCATREVAEEVGAAGLQVETFLTGTRHEYEQNGERFLKTTRWYCMTPARNDADLFPQREEQIEALDWVPVREAKERVGYENLVRVLEAFEETKGLT